MKRNWILDETVRHAIEETWAVLTSGSDMLNPAQFLVRVADLARSNSFLWTEAGLQVQERSTRALKAGQGISRSLVMATVAADIFVGYATLRERARWLPGLVKSRDWHMQHQRSANRVLDTSASLGGALIKACQFASTRPDLLPMEYIRTLAPLQDSMPPRSWKEIEQAITNELGRPPSEVFAEIEHEAVAAASIAQVHRAWLPDGRAVAVKVQYPDISDVIATDLAVLEQIVKAIARLAPSIQLQPIIDYLKETLPMELDFIHEREAMTSLRAALAHRTDALVPQAVPELSTERLLVMEYAGGIKITDRAALEEAGISPHEVAVLLNDLYAEQILRLGMLHADPHPGNLRVQAGPRLVLLDHGLTVPLKPELVASLKKMVQSLTSGDFDGLIQALSDAGLKFEGDVDIVALMNLMGVLLGNAQSGEDDGDTGEASEASEASEAGDGENETESDAVGIGLQIGRSIGAIPIDLLLVGRALGLLDGITKQLDPNMDTMEIVAHYT